MRFGMRDNLLWIGIVTAFAGLAVSGLASGPDAGPQCKSSGCTYVAADGKTFRGTCGSRQDDDKRCYCTEVVEKTPPDPKNNQEKEKAKEKERFQVQAGCQK